MSERCGKKLLRYCTSPSDLCTPALSVCAGISLIARTLAGSTRRPSSVAMCPMNGTSFCQRSSLSVFSFFPFALQCLRKLVRTWS